eukprot:TRINITY_DN10220_c0_g2_i1.p1 TRINITY_DN10220_c0_g2~~TRINITY_DN10220_c0_g2_i1.p1  ORF type:complete len:308 (+),score=70.50 TRINITY_DN10220_c0_g2_i1:248-1171(+)
MQIEVQPLLLAANIALLSAVVWRLSRQSSPRPAPEQPPKQSREDSSEEIDGRRMALCRSPVNIVSDDTDIQGVTEGFSMEDARKHSEECEAVHQARTPSQVLSELQRGNARFWLGQSAQKHGSAFERRALIMKQYPKCAILGCSDSRVPIEIVFDQGLGDIFVIRVAGNCLDVTTKASLEYAVNHLGVKVLMIMGHEGCGAVRAAALPTEQIEGEPDNLSKLLKNIKVGLDEDRLQHVHDPRAHDREAVVTNVCRQVESLTRDESLMSKVRSKELIVLGAFYEISSGIVDFFHKVSGSEQPEGVTPT